MGQGAWGMGQEAWSMRTVDLIWRTGAVRPAVSAASNESDKFRPGARMWVMLGSAHRTQPRALRPPFAVGANKSTDSLSGRSESLAG